ncbi:hypothetical protein MtrunA17_Chr6g0471361 [Medicago truncatula]|uniref:Transmembrane protein n=1 Tax=Medicago truncatula TaxID=3880 RepID=A0A396HGH4_MEDTR|nr:hypothetical protein MtrunA17_Chr6g0471361 [Medicago truncatula]
MSILTENYVCILDFCNRCALCFYFYCYFILVKSKSKFRELIVLSRICSFPAHICFRQYQLICSSTNLFHY